VTDTLLRSLREHLLDESEPLAGLLRKCLLLGAETGSEALRGWARMELNGYGDEDEVPAYRKLQDVPVSMDSISGRRWKRGEVISRLNLPLEAQKCVPEELQLKHPIEELQHLAGQKTLTLTSPGLILAQAIWNKKLGPFQSVEGLYYVISGSTIAGVLGQIRTKLVEIVADLTVDTPLSELPKKGRVDAVMTYHIGDIYNTTIQTANGPVAVGAKAKASMEGLTVEDAFRLLEKVQQAAGDLADSQRGELLDLLTELRGAMESDEPNAGEVVDKVGKLRALAGKLGVASVEVAASAATRAITELALSGVFG